MKIGLLTLRHLLGFGVDLVVHKMAQHLASWGHDVSVLANMSSDGFPDINYKLISLPIEMHEDPAEIYRSSLYYRDYINQQNYDCLIFHTLPFYYVLDQLESPRKVIIEYGTSDTLFFPLEKKLNFHLNEYLTKNQYYQHADLICPISQFLADRQPDKLNDKTKVVQLGADHYSHFQVTDADLRAERKRLGIKPNEKILLYVGRLNYEQQPYKNTRTLLSIYQTLRQTHPDVRLIMVGYGSEEDANYLRTMDVIPVLKAPFEKMSLYYQLCDIFCTATLWEGFDLPLVEAQIYGKPGIAFRIGAHPEVCLPNETAFLVHSETEFLEKIKLLINNPAIYTFMSEKAREYAAKYTWERSVREYEKLILALPVKGEDALPAITEKQPLISIILLNYNSPVKLLEDCLGSIQTQSYQNFEIIFIDNHSPKKFYKDVDKTYYEKTTFIENKKNYGFSKAINQGINASKGEWLLILNCDTILDTFFIENFIKNYRPENPEIAGYAPKMYLASEYKVLDSIGTGINERAEAFNIGIGEIDLGQYDQMEQVMGVCFGACFIRRTAFEDVGMLDESYRMYFEDVDWCLRANLFGLKFLSLPKSVIYHYHSATLRDVKYNWKYELIELNLLKTAYKNFRKSHFMNVFQTRVKNYLLTSDADRSFMISNQNIIEDFQKEMEELTENHNRIQQKKCVSEDRVFAINTPPTRCFFDPQTYTTHYTQDNLYASVEAKSAKGTANANDLYLWRHFKHHGQSDQNLYNLKHHFIRDMENPNYHQMVFNILPRNVELMSTHTFAESDEISQVYRNLPQGSIRQISFFINNRQRKNKGTFRCILKTGKTRKEITQSFPETTKNLWLHFDCQFNHFSNEPVEIILNTDIAARPEEQPELALSQTQLYPDCMTSAAGFELDGNIPIKIIYTENKQEIDQQ